MIIYCNKCSIELGNILKGSKLRKGIVFLCSNCFDKLKVLEDLNNFERGKESGNTYSGSDGMPDFFKDIFTE